MTKLMMAMTMASVIRLSAYLKSGWVTVKLHKHTRTHTHTNKQTHMPEQTSLYVILRLPSYAVCVHSNFSYPDTA